MLALKLAIRNLIGAGLRTWLNVFVLSLAFIIIIFYNGWLEGWNQEARTDTINWEIGGGQLWHSKYDPYDPFTYSDAHSTMNEAIKKDIDNGDLTPILIAQATAYPENGMQTVILKGISPDQKILKIPSSLLGTKSNEIQAIIGSSEADHLKIKKNDHLTLRWRDKNGVFDANEVRIIDIFQSNVPTVDVGQIWISLTDLQKITEMHGEATYLVAKTGFLPKNSSDWFFKNNDFLLKDIDTVIKSKKAASSILYGFVMLLALLAIFDTQVLSIFRRQREIGTYIALGMTRAGVVKLFTIEGAAHSLLAIALGAIWGFPILYYLSKFGIKIPMKSEEMGLPFAQTMFPVYGFWLVTGTIFFIIVSATIVSYLPARRITKINPTDALKGKIS